MNDIQSSFSSACRRAKIKGLQFRDLRRTFSSRLHEQGVDALIIKRLLRNKTFKISEEVYIQSSMKQLKEAVEKMDKNESSLTHDRHTDEGKRKRLLEIPLFSMN